jgi:hypothetical protein
MIAVQGSIERYGIGKHVPKAAKRDQCARKGYNPRLRKVSSCPRTRPHADDYDRTFPHHDFFTDGSGIGQENLFNVLKAYSL